ncbi:hypothetical protein Y1Q_0010807 [Alligator mississippiensis]|uniref:Uncharacterized protein n=1 Tax=Alligator mississippiensis TaxID=8496 RepID=A0A151M709_ALLMI|nr:hypothetical protein Y1Q_0010807 [Alligator mississippiensis]
MFLCNASPVPAFAVCQHSESSSVWFNLINWALEDQYFCKGDEYEHACIAFCPLQLMHCNRSKFGRCGLLLVSGCHK